MKTDLVARTRFTSSITRVVRTLGIQIVVVFSGGCPLKKYVELVAEACTPHGVSVLGFGKPFQADVNAIPEVLRTLAAGTTLTDIAGMLKFPQTLVYCPGELNRDDDMDSDGMKVAVPLHR